MSTQKFHRTSTSLTAAGAVLALAAGTLVAAGPAQAASATPGTQHTLTCPQGTRLPIRDLSGSAAQQWATADVHNHPFPFGGQMTTGIPNRFQQGAVGSGIIRPQYQKGMMGRFVDAPDGKYVVSIGDGICGTTGYARVKGGKLNLRDVDPYLGATGNQLVYVAGPVKPNDTDPRHPIYADGRIANPVVSEAGIYRADAGPEVSVAPGTEGRQGADRVPVVTQGHTTIPLTAGDATLKNGTKVQALTSIHANQGVRIASGLEIRKTGTGYEIAGDMVRRLPSGRYAFTFRSAQGPHTVYAMIADGKSTSESQFYGGTHLYE